MMDKKKIQKEIIDEVKNFDLLTEWIGGHSLNGLKKDNYRLFDIPVEIDYVIDIGTCIGEVAYACSRLFPNAYVVAVEACPSTYFGAAKNLKNSNIRIDHFGIYEKDNDILFINDNMKGNIGSKTTKKASENNCNCLSIKFETLLKKHNIDLNKNCLLKIDCEGCERWVFDKPELCQKFYQISCEIHDPHKDNMKDIIQKFYERMKETHDVIKGKCVMSGRPEIVFRKKEVKEIKGRKIFIDCGCNVGNIILDFVNEKSKYFGKRDDALEYEFFGFDHLKHKRWDKIQKLLNVKFEEKLIWNKNEKVEFSFDEWNEGNTITSISSARKKFTKISSAIDFSEFIKNNFEINDYIVLKMDIETSEYVVLPHLIETKAIDYINELYVEFHLRYNKGMKETRNNIVKYLKNKKGLHFKIWH